MKVVVELLEGRSPEQKATIVNGIAETFATVFDISLDAVTVSIAETSFCNMASSGKLRSDTAEGESKYGALLEPRLTILYANEHSVDQRRKAVKQITERISAITGVSDNDVLIFFHRIDDGAAVGDQFDCLTERRMFRVTVELPAGYVSEAKEGRKNLSHRIWMDLCGLYGQKGAVDPDVICRIRTGGANAMITFQCIAGDIGTSEQRLEVVDRLKGAVFAETSVAKEKITVFLMEIPADQISVNGMLVCDSIEKSSGYAQDHN